MYRKSQLSWHKQERLLEHFVSGSTARCAARLVGVNKRVPLLIIFIVCERLLLTRLSKNRKIILLAR